MQAQSHYCDQLSIAAHSFGCSLTTLMLEHLHKTQRSLKLHKILLAGSSCKPDFPWANYSDYVGKVRHEFCPQDEVISAIPLGQMAPGIIPSLLGASGLLGFTHSQGLEQESFPFKGHRERHCRFVIEEHIVDHWFPFLLDLDFWGLCHESVAHPGHFKQFVTTYGPFIVRALGTLAKSPGCQPLMQESEHQEVIQTILRWGSGIYCQTPWRPFQIFRPRAEEKATRLIQEAIKASQLPWDQGTMGA